MQKNVKKLTLIAVLTAIALIIFVVEAQIPLPLPIPGVKLGLANAVTLFALFYSKKNVEQDILTAKDAFAILLGRIILGGIFTGRFVAFLYSIAGGILAFAVQILMKRFVTQKQIWVCGAIGAVFHNVGQIIVAVLITGSTAIFAYLPILIITGIITGVITGFIAQLTLERLIRL